MQPWMAFILGVVLSNLFQWAQWVSTRTDKKGAARWFGYWEIGLPHLVMNITIDVLLCVAWADNKLDFLVGLIPGGPENIGIPYVPGIGLGLGFGVDLFADKIVYIARKVVGSRLPFLKTTEESDPPNKGGDQ